MNTVITRQPRRERLADLADAMTQGVWPPDVCLDCRRLHGWCPHCAAMDADLRVLSDEVLPAIQAASTDEQARTAFYAGLMRLTGDSAEEITAAVAAAGGRS